MKHIFLLSIIMLLSGCATTMSERAANVQVHSQMSTLLDKCERVGPVTGVGSKKWTIEGAESISAAEIDLREKAAQSGDSVVKLDGQFFNGKYQIHGIVFNCYGKRASN